jgi:hypothetical protein
MDKPEGHRPQMIQCPHCDGRGYTCVCLACGGDGWVVLEEQLELEEADNA